MFDWSIFLHGLRLMLPRHEKSLKDCIVRLGKVEQASKLASASLGATWNQSVESPKDAKVTLCQRKEMSNKVQPLEGEVSHLKLQMSKGVKTSDDANNPATRHSRQLSMLEVRIVSLKEELKSLIRKESTSCDTEVGRRNEADVKGDMGASAGGLR